MGATKLFVADVFDSGKRVADDSIAWTVLGDSTINLLLAACFCLCTNCFQAYLQVLFPRQMKQSDELEAASN